MTAKRIGLLEWTPTEYINLFGWRSCEDVVRYAVYTDIQVYLDTSRMTLKEIDDDDDDEGVYFYTDIWVPSSDIRTPCILGIGVMTRLQMVQMFDPVEPTLYLKNMNVVYYSPSELDFKPLSVLKARNPTFIPKHLNTFLHSFNMLAKSLNILISTGMKDTFYISKFCLQKLGMTVPPQRVLISACDDGSKVITVPCQLNPTSCPTFDFTLGSSLLTTFRCIIDYAEGKVYFLIKGKTHMTTTQVLRDIPRDKKNTSKPK